MNFKEIYVNGWSGFKWLVVQRQALMNTVVNVKAGKLARPLLASQDGLCSMELVCIL
jgi:hypothetical protein